MSANTPGGRATAPGTDVPLDRVPAATDLPHGPGRDLDEPWEGAHRAVTRTRREPQGRRRAGSADEDAGTVTGSVPGTVPRAAGEPSGGGAAQRQGLRGPGPQPLGSAR